MGDHNGRLCSLFVTGVADLDAARVLATAVFAVEKTADAGGLADFALVHTAGKQA